MKKGLTRKAAAILFTAALVLPASQGLAAETMFANEAVSNMPSIVTLNKTELEKFAESFFAEEKLKAWDVPGAIISVVQNNQVIYQQGFGVEDAGTKQPVSASQSKFRVGSVAKVVTATAIMQLVEQGKLSLDGGVNDYLPEAWIRYPEGQPVTIAHLLTHTTGFDGGLDIRPGDIYYTLNDYYDLESYVKASIPALVRQPGEAFKYDNFASMLQGYIVEYVSGQSFEEYVQEHIFAPLGMKHSGFRVTPESAKGMATGYMPGGQGLPQYGIKPSDLPQGGWFTTAADAAKFMMAHLNRGEFDGQRILNPESAEMMQTYQVYVQPDAPVMAYGFEASMFPQYDRGQLVFSKGGDTLGFSSMMWLLPEHQLGLFVSVNGNNGMVREELYRDFMAAFLPDASVKKQTLSTPIEDLKRFEGSFMDLRLESWKSEIAATGAATLTMQDSLYGTVELTQVGPMTFVDPVGIELIFKGDEQGTPQYFKYRNVGYSVRIEASTYADLPKDHEYAPYVYDLQGYNIFKEERVLFRPEEAVSRSEFVAYFIRLLKLPISPNPAIFQDTEGHALAKEVQTAAELGLVLGKPDGRFSPDQPLTREEAAVILYRLMQLQGAGAAPQAPLKDQPSAWALDAVNMMMLAGFYGPEVTMGADGSWDYRPGAAMLRKEAAALLAKLVQIPQQSN